MDCDYISFGGLLQTKIDTVYSQTTIVLDRICNDCFSINSSQWYHNHQARGYLCKNCYRKQTRKKLYCSNCKRSQSNSWHLQKEILCNDCYSLVCVVCRCLPLHFKMSETGSICNCLPSHIQVPNKDTKKVCRSCEATVVGTKTKTNQEIYAENVIPKKILFVLI
jgi:hypothetical protein